MDTKTSVKTEHKSDNQNKVVCKENSENLAYRIFLHEFGTDRETIEKNLKAIGADSDEVLGIYDGILDGSYNQR